MQRFLHLREMHLGMWKVKHCLPKMFEFPSKSNIFTWTYIDVLRPKKVRALKFFFKLSSRVGAKILKFQLGTLLSKNMTRE